MEYKLIRGLHQLVWYTHNLSWGNRQKCFSILMFCSWPRGGTRFTHISSNLLKLLPLALSWVTAEASSGLHHPFPFKPFEPWVESIASGSCLFSLYGDVRFGLYIDLQLQTDSEKLRESEVSVSLNKTTSKVGWILFLGGKLTTSWNLKKEF